MNNKSNGVKHKQCYILQLKHTYSFIQILVSFFLMNKGLGGVIAK